MSEDERIWYELGIIIGKKEYEDKIKAKIEEIEKECKNCEFRKFLCKYCFTEKGINILQSLSEKRSKINE